VSFVASGRFAEDQVPDDWGSVAPDVAVEVISPGDRPRHVLDEVGEYLEAGVRLVWVIHRRYVRAAVYRSISDVRELERDGVLEGEDVIPGFRLALRDVL
jgi:Uma2 family endonuclease